MAEEFIPVRVSHLLLHCSVGSIVRSQENLLVVPDIRSWCGRTDDPLTREIRYVDQVKGALGISQSLCRPPILEERNGLKSGWIPVQRFPEWVRCLKCGLLHRAPWRNKKRGGGKCWGPPNGKPCDGILEQVPWVMVHKDGYLAEVPWHSIAHSDSRRCRTGSVSSDHSSNNERHKPYLQLITDSAVAPVVKCIRCKARGNLDWRLPFPATTWQQPWIRQRPANVSEEPAWIMGINDVRVHRPVTKKALVIPPESRIRRGTVEDRLYNSTVHRESIDKAPSRLARKSAVRRVATEFRCEPGDIEAALVKIAEGYPLYGAQICQEGLHESEFGALTEPIPDLHEEEDFVTEHFTESWKLLRNRYDDGLASSVLSSVDRLVAVNRLKEILVFTGFERALGDTVPPDVVGESAWLPALELRGEGIFFTLNEELLSKWESEHYESGRVSRLVHRFNNSVLQRTYPDIVVSARLILCHTLAHILIRQLESAAGYPAASLKERIYCSVRHAGQEDGQHDEQDAPDQPMAGILIYVAVADEEGSLGGLVELAEPQRFLRLLTGALEDSLWCSFDPVCGERDGHGPDLLNGAACHACSLLPETSCELGNVLLDRTFVVGAGPDSNSFFKPVE